jgi:hypothetical protein
VRKLTNAVIMALWIVLPLFSLMVVITAVSRGFRQALSDNLELVGLWLAIAAIITFVAWLGSLFKGN